MTLNPDQAQTLMAMAAIVHAKDQLRNKTYYTQDRKRLEATLPSEWDVHVSYNGDVIPVHVQRGDGNFIVTIGGKDLRINDNFNLATPVISTTVNGQEEIFQLQGRGVGHIKIQFHGTVFEVQVLEKRMADVVKYMPEKHVLDLSSKVIAPMPGVVKSVAVTVGQVIGEGQEVCVLEAMKMQNSMLAGKTGKVKNVFVKAGDTVGEDDVLVELE